MHVSPWHMWGGTVTTDLIITPTPVDSQTVKSQMARIDYGRPETWTFLFAVNVTTAPGNAAQTLQLDVFWDLFLGIGRTQVSLLGFGQITIGGAKLSGLSRWTTVVKAPELNAFATYTPDLTKFPAQSINCSTRARCFQQVGGGNLGESVSCEVTALFAPTTHVRPEWNGTAGHNNVPRFNGGEDRGS